jgi:hypothetical protein
MADATVYEQTLRKSIDDFFAHAQIPRTPLLTALLITVFTEGYQAAFQEMLLDIIFDREEAADAS